MKRLVIIVEGDTEKEFVDKTLSPYLNQKGIYNISSYKITKTNGGLVSYLHLKRDLVKAIQEQNTFVTTLVDFYALPDNFPNYSEAQQIVDKNDKLIFLENAIINDIQQDFGIIDNLLPYIQLHEFEALLFTDIKGFKNNLSEKEANLKELEAIIRSFPNPEEINDHILTAPSKRLKKLIPSYRKIVYGNIIIEDNSIEMILQKCPRFKRWIQALINNCV